MGASVERCELAPGFSISRILTGLWQIADMERDGRSLDLQAAAESMLDYQRAGLTTFDMADHYGSAEDIAGIFLHRLGTANPVQIATKWVPKPGPVTSRDVREAVLRSLQRLQTDRIDLLQFHAWTYDSPDYLDALFYLHELQQEGLIRFLGLTNFDTAHLRVVLTSGIPVISNQVSFSLLDQRAGGAMSRLCMEHGVRLLVYGTLAGGFLTDRYLGKPEPGLDQLATWSEMKYKRFLDSAGGWEPLQGLLATLAGVAGRHRVSIANVASRFILEQPAVGGVIIGARLGLSQHIDENLRLFQFSLLPEDHAEIEAALQRFNAIPGDCGDEYRKPPFLTASGDLSHHVDAFPLPFRVEEDEGGRSRVRSGTTWEDQYGYCRAVRVGSRVWVSGTTASHRDRLIGGHDPAAQAHFVIDKIEGALRSVGGRLSDVVRTRVFVSRLADWEAVAAAHGQRFAKIKPANTLVQARLIGDQFLVEMEAEAVLGTKSGAWQ